MTIEHAVVIGGDAPLMGIVTVPANVDARPQLPCLILLNSGLLHRVGPHRLYVHLARRLAQRGFTTLRLDLSAIGDSPVRNDDLPFNASSVAETRNAIQFMRKTWGCERFVLGGICTGAVVSMRTALEDEAVEGLLLINTQGLLGPSTPEVQQSVQQSADARYYMKSALRNAGSWKKLLSGRADYAAIGRSLSHRLRRAVPTTAPVAAGAAQQSIVASVERLLAEKRQMMWLFSDSDPGIDELQLIFGDQGLARLKRAGNCSYQLVHRADHMFSLPERQEAFFELVTRWMSEHWLSKGTRASAHLQATSA